MMGYSVKHKRMVKMTDIQTIKMPDLSFLHRGKFTDKKGTHIICRRVYPTETIITDSGHHYPREVFVGPATPPKIYRDPVGQKIVIKEKHIETVKEDGSLKQKEELIEEVKENVKDMVERGIVSVDGFYANILTGHKFGG